MKALIIRTDNSIDVFDKEWKLDDIQDAVGGNIESVPHPFRATTFFGHDEAKYAGEGGRPLPLNMVATIICQSRLQENDVICGDIVVLGYDEQSGESKDVSDFATRAINFMANFVNENFKAHIVPEPKGD